MKFTPSLILLLLVSSLHAQTKKVDYEVSYDFVWITDTVTNELAARGVEYLLLHSGDESRFLSSNRNFNDSMTVEFEKEHPGLLSPRMDEESQKAVDLFMKSFKN